MSFENFNLRKVDLLITNSNIIKSNLFPCYKDKFKVLVEQKIKSGGNIMFVV